MGDLHLLRQCQVVMLDGEIATAAVLWQTLLPLMS